MRLAREELPARAYYASLGSGRETALDRALVDFDRLECTGVPTFVLDGEGFWGKDRVDWLLDAVRRRLAS